MAHNCPECESICYCGGDIDDLLLNDESDINACHHWETCNPEEEYDDDFWDAPLN